MKGERALGLGWQLPALVVAILAAPANVSAQENRGYSPRELVSRLGSDSWREREFASSRLIELGEGALAALAGALRDADSEVFWRALDALGAIGPEAKATLEKAASDASIPKARRVRIRKVLAGLEGPGFLGIFIGAATVPGGGVNGGDGGDGGEAGGTRRAVAVLSVIERSPAERSGLRKGDVIVKLDGKRARSPAELVELVQSHKAGTKVKIELIRSGEPRELEVRLASRASAPGNE